MILVVDDDQAFLQKAQTVFAKTPHSDLIFATDAVQAIRLLTALGDDFSVALIDLDLPGVNGFDLIGKVRKQFPKLPVIAISGVYAPSTLESAKAVGGDEVLTKPITQEWKATLARVRNLKH
jgi:CheY-like chemotaxis protein